MDNHKPDEEPILGVGVDYKTLFMGACTIVVLLVGSLYGLWSRGNEQAAEDSRTTNGKQWERIVIAESAIKELQWNVARLSRLIEENVKVIQDNEKKLLMLERKGKP